MFTLDQVMARTVNHPQNVVTLVCIFIIFVFPCLTEAVASNNEYISVRPIASKCSHKAICIMNV
jgi:hypothetical protein